MLLDPTVSIVLIVVPVGIPEPVIFCPVPSSKCVRLLFLVSTVNVLVPPAVASALATILYVNCVVDTILIFFIPL